MDACAGPAATTLAVFLGALSGRPVRKNSYTAPPSSTSRTVAATFCFVFMIRFKPFPVFVSSSADWTCLVYSLSLCVAYFPRSLRLRGVLKQGTVATHDPSPAGLANPLFSRVSHRAWSESLGFRTTQCDALLGKH